MYHNEWPHLYSIFRFKLWHIPLLELINLSVYISYNFVDVILVCVALGVIERFKQFYHRILCCLDKPLEPESLEFWTNIRLHFESLIDLLQLVDRRFSMLIILSSVNSLFFTCYNVFWIIW